MSEKLEKARLYEIEEAKNIPQEEKPAFHVSDRYLFLFLFLCLTKRLLILVKIFLFDCQIIRQSILLHLFQIGIPFFIDAAIQDPVSAE